MRKFVLLCIDNKTNMKMIYSECSYNMACMEIESEMTAQGKHFVSAKTDREKGMTRIEFSDNNVFYYDEDRGLLLKDEEFLPVGYQFFED